MKNLILTIFLIVSIAPATLSQSLTVRPVDNTATNSISTFPLEKGTVRLGSSQVRFLDGGPVIDGLADFSASPDYTLMGALRSGAKGSALLMTSSGDTLSAFGTIALGNGDPSLGVFTSNSGAMLIRDNIANFNLYDAFGSRLVNVSASSQSKGGETMSEMAADPGWQTVVLYVPKIKRGDEIGSKAQYLDHDHKLQDLFYRSDRSISSVEVSGNGNFVVIVSSKPGTDDTIHLLDRYGNELNSFTEDENLAGASVSLDGGYLTAWSQKRLLVYEALTGERIGSTSFRSELFKARYFPADEVILAMTGDYSGGSGIVNNVEFHAIDLGRRKVERKEFGAALGFSKAINSRFVRTARHRYRLEGANHTLGISVSF